MLNETTKKLLIEDIAKSMSPDGAFVPAPGNGVSEKSVSKAFTDVIKWLDEKADTGSKASMSFDTYRELVGVPADLPSERDGDAQAFYDAVNSRLAEYAERNGIRFVNYGGGDGIEVEFTKEENEE